MSRKIKFVMPTLFHREEIEIECAETLCHQSLKHNPENEVHMVCNFDSMEFAQWQPKYPHIKKHISHLMYNISKAVNVVALEENTKDFDYFCFVHSDVFFEDETWIEKCIEVYETHGNVGVIGITSHSTFERYHKQITNIGVNGINEMYEVLWSDGIMFFSTKLFDKIGYFDERFFGDCESQDFCYSAFEKGYKNIYIPDHYLNSKHITTPFRYKSPKTELLLNTVERSQKLFFHKWEHMFKKYFQNTYEKQAKLYNNLPKDETKMKKIFVITTHCSNEYWDFGNYHLYNCLDSLREIKPDKIIIVDNQSTIKPDLNKFKDLNIDYIYVENQLERGLTGAWNIGINAAIQYGPSLICNTNSDVEFDLSYNNLYNHIVQDKDSSTTIYGSKTNNPGWQTTQYVLDRGAYILSGNNKVDILNGFCMFFTTDFYHKHQELGLLFSNEKERPWGGNEQIMCHWSKTKNTCIKVLNNCFIYHKKAASWRNLVK